MEIWKDIEGFEGVYQISNYGRVKSLRKKCGTIIKEESMRKLSLTRDGYYKVRLIRGDKDVTTRVHRLVAKAFIPNPENKETVNHIDGNKLNNHVDNLEWSTRHEQLQHAYDLGLKKPHRGAKNSQAKLTNEQAEEIRRTYVKHSKNGKSSSVALAKKYGVTNRVILLIVNNKSYL